ncbi:hypothetical protein G7046_g1958 [Stylonectria norvegica]|nr:hypothetical protein G7046_g1958 [Stylonectria norvegica]
MPHASGISIYAELLSNIKQISVVVTLSTPADASTSAKLSDHGRQLEVKHQDRVQSLTLPGQVIPTTVISIPKQNTLDLSWRLPVASPLGVRPAQFSPESQALPWTSVDIEAGSHVCCRTCAQEVIQEGQIKVWKDLPSENWAEMMEFWHCHKPSDHDHHDSESLADKGYGANNVIDAQPGVGFVDLSSFLVAESDCHGLAYSSSTVESGLAIKTLALKDITSRKPPPIFCKNCNTELGVINAISSSVTLFKWLVTCQTFTTGAAPSASECLAATLIATISRSGSSKSVITPHLLGPSRSAPDKALAEKGQVLYLWILNPNVVLVPTMDKLSEDLPMNPLPACSLRQSRPARRAKYIPAGSLKVITEESNLSSESWSLAELRIWNAFHQPNVVLAQSDLEKSRLRPDVQASLLKAPILAPFAGLFEASWITLTFSTHAEGSPYGTLRVYLLPDDVQRGLLNRSSLTRRKLRQTLLSKLNYAKDAWNGKSDAGIIQNPLSYENSDLIDDSTDRTYGSEDETDVSLLRLFNKIPSPKPDLDLIIEPQLRNTMGDLLNSNIDGLLTTLYPYQRRSAALMLQREACPGSNVDPRLLHVQDQEGFGWYYDPVEGTVLEEPRYYDGISGGILAEEMGSGKTIICLALILATKGIPAQPPELYSVGHLQKRKRIGSLADMAAACATRHSVAWKPYFETYRKQFGLEFDQCIAALKRNSGFYICRAPSSHRVGSTRGRLEVEQTHRVYLSTGSIVVVPANLVAQWKQEIAKHSEGLDVLTISKNEKLPPGEILANYDIILFSEGLLETMVKSGEIYKPPLSKIRFKRCIVDEGHKLGSSRIGHKTNLSLGLEALNVEARWIMTGTPAHGLFGVDSRMTAGAAAQEEGESRRWTKKTKGANESSVEMERRDLERIGSIASLYLKARPWANASNSIEHGDTPADWSVYLMLPKHKARSRGHLGCLRSTLNSLIIRHQLSEVGDLLPPVNEQVVVLDGSYQDQLTLNLFSMIIVFNSIQSQRTDMDYFFHPKQKQSLLQIAQNLKQASFFGGSFFTHHSISRAVKTAEEFLRDKKIPISVEDELLLKEAIDFGHVAMGNKLRNTSNTFHDLPVSVKDFRGGAGPSWSLDGEIADPICSSAGMLVELQKLISDSATKPEELNSLLNGRLIQEGIRQREKLLKLPHHPTTGPIRNQQTFAGNTKVENDTSSRKPRSQWKKVKGDDHDKIVGSDTYLGPLESTSITSTASSKMSYLIDSIMKHQNDEKIIVFYESENTAWYLASMLDVLQVQHLIYAKSLNVERRAHYVNTFHLNPTFRVLLMDLSQAAFGLDMREASRIYFINPVLNPQVEAQAIGRIRRISQQKPVTVETLVLRNSIEEVILERKKNMTQTEHRQARTILDIRPIHDWIKNAKIVPLPQGDLDFASQMTPLHPPQYLFRRGFGRTMHPDDGIMLDDSAGTLAGGVVEPTPSSRKVAKGIKREHETGWIDGMPGQARLVDAPDKQHLDLANLTVSRRGAASIAASIAASNPSTGFWLRGWWCIYATGAPAGQGPSQGLLVDEQAPTRRPA